LRVLAFPATAGRASMAPAAAAAVRTKSRLCMITISEEQSLLDATDAT